jgi:MATE family, multidrug efflux pump
MSLFAQSLSENRRTLALASPIIAGYVGQMLMGWADTVMVGRVGVIPLAACAFANTVLAVPLVFGFAVLSSVSVRASLAFGAGRARMAGEALRPGLVVGSVLGVSVAVAIHAALPLLPWLGQGPEINAASKNFLLLCSWSALPVFLTTVAKNFCEAHSRPWVPFWIMIGGVLLNVGLNWIFIYGNLGAPAMGLDGAGVATLLARIAVAVAIIVYALLARALKDSLPVNWLATGLGSEMRRLLVIGLPSGGMHLTEVSGFAFGSLMMGWLGAGALAAHQIAITCAATTFMIPLGLSQAVSVRIGQARGAEEQSRYLPIICGALGMAVLVMAIFAVAFMSAGATIAAWFHRECGCCHAGSATLARCGILSNFRRHPDHILRGLERLRRHTRADVDRRALLLASCASDLVPLRIQTRVWPIRDLVRFRHRPGARRNGLCRTSVAARQARINFFRRTTNSSIVR